MTDPPDMLATPSRDSPEPALGHDREQGSGRNRFQSCHTKGRWCYSSGMNKRKPTEIPGRRTKRRIEAPANTAVAYLRVSTNEQTVSGLGLEAQRATITAEVKKRGWTITEWFIDEGLSGGLAPAKRPGMRAALAAVKGHEAATLVAAKMDRLSRSMLDAVTLLNRSLREDWQFVTCDGISDTSTPAGRAAAHMLMTFGEFERDSISQRTRDALASLKAKGVQLGTPTQVPDEVLRRVISEAAAGVSLRKIAVGLMADGILTGSGSPTWHAEQVKRAMDCQRGREIAAELFGSTDDKQEEKA